MPWDPEQYGRFRQERAQPFYDLLAGVELRPGLRIIDLGCGTGELSRVLLEQSPGARVVGVDSSSEMLAQAAARAGPGLAFVRADLSDYAPEGPVDLVISNAALQWVGEHEKLLGRLRSLLAPGGQLAVQMPKNDDHPTHRLAQEVAAEPPFAAHVAGSVRPPVLSAERYASLLFSLGAPGPVVQERIYGHPLASLDEAVEWVKGTLLVPILDRLPEPLRRPYLARYRDRMARALGDPRPFFYTYRRLFFWARFPPV